MWTRSCNCDMFGQFVVFVSAVGGGGGRDGGFCFVHMACNSE